MAEIATVAGNKDICLTLYSCGKNGSILSGKGQSFHPDDQLRMGFGKDFYLLYNCGQVGKFVWRLFLNVSDGLFMGEGRCAEGTFPCRGQSEQST